MGNADNTPMAPGTFSSQGVGPIWRRFMNEAHAYLGITKHDFTIPDSIQFLSCAGKNEVFKRNTPTVKNGACRGPSGQPDQTATPTPKGPLFPTDTPTPTPLASGQETRTPAPGEVTPAPTERPEIFYYTARPGDTPQSVAALFGVDVEDLAKANGLDPNQPITPGIVLVIPGGGGG
jgi:membrane peptidoglycan carboxypeptidase